MLVLMPPKGKERKECGLGGEEGASQLGSISQMGKLDSFVLLLESEGLRMCFIVVR